MRKHIFISDLAQTLWNLHFWQIYYLESLLLVKWVFSKEDKVNEFWQTSNLYQSRSSLSETLFMKSFFFFLSKADQFLEFLCIFKESWSKSKIFRPFLRKILETFSCFGKVSFTTSETELDQYQHRVFVRVFERLKTPLRPLPWLNNRDFHLNVRKRSINIKQKLFYKLFTKPFWHIWYQ